jgi:lipopolysaccharide biosynthesis glycosyltransferase
MDCDMLVTRDVRQLFAFADPTKAVQVVKHNYQPAGSVKMDNQVQTVYPRKLWSAVMLFNCNHPANDRLTLDYVNDLPGRDLHAFSWLEDDQIGELPESWHWIAGYSSLIKGMHAAEPALIHWTEGGPWFPNFRNVPYANEWRAERNFWLRSV